MRPFFSPFVLFRLRRRNPCSIIVGILACVFQENFPWRLYFAFPGFPSDRIAPKKHRLHAYSNG